MPRAPDCASTATPRSTGCMSMSLGGRRGGRRAAWAKGEMKNGRPAACRRPAERAAARGRGRARVDERGVEPHARLGGEEAERVRANDPHVEFLGDLQELGLALDALRAGLAEARGDDKQAADALGELRERWLIRS